MTPDEILMAHVREVHGEFIADAVKGTPFPAALIAALDANETGGDATKTRFEPAVFGKLAKVMLSLEAEHPAQYGSIGAQDLEKWVVTPDRKFNESLLALVNLATSWGPTQIMGYEALAGEFAISQLTDPKFHFGHTVNLLDEFRKRFNLTVGIGAYWEPFFRCWNAGHPNGVTTDPLYVTNGLARGKIYEMLP